jgi:hypothetical protein
MNIFSPVSATTLLSDGTITLRLFSPRPLFTDHTSSCNAIETGAEIPLIAWFYAAWAKGFAIFAPKVEAPTLIVRISRSFRLHSCIAATLRRRNAPSGVLVA